MSRQEVSPTDWQRLNTASQEIEALQEKAEQLDHVSSKYKDTLHDKNSLQTKLMFFSASAPAREVRIGVRLEIKSKY